MKRRQFLGSLGGTIAALKTRSLLGDKTPRSVPSSADNYTNVLAVEPGDAAAYFSEEKLKDAVDTSVSLLNKKFEVVAYNYPGWSTTISISQIIGASKGSPCSHI